MCTYCGMEYAIGTYQVSIFILLWMNWSSFYLIDSTIRPYYILYVNVYIYYELMGWPWPKKIWRKYICRVHSHSRCGVWHSNNQTKDTGDEVRVCRINRNVIDVQPTTDWPDPSATKWTFLWFNWLYAREMLQHYTISPRCSQLNRSDTDSKESNRNYLL